MDTTFTPIASFNGGILVGLGVVLLMAGLGRIYGATGILSGLFFPGDRQEFTWRMALVAGMVLSPLLMLSVTGSMPEITVPVNPFMITAGGLIVGIGASLGSGCTSGHGICGLSRFSIRSMIAVPTFMVTAALTVFIIRHVAGV